MCKIVEEYGDERAAEAFKQGELKKAIEATLVLINEFKIEAKAAAEKMKAPFEMVQEALNSTEQR